MAIIKKKVFKFDGVTHPEELAYRLSFFMLRRTKRDVALELPPKTRIVIPIDVASKYQVTFDHTTPRTVIRKMLDRAADGKLPAVIQMAADDLTGGAKIVVATYRKAVAEHIVDALGSSGFDVGLIHGEISTAKRLEVLRRAKAATTPFAIVATIDSISTSINLSFMNEGICVELPYVWQTLAQWESRMHRYGQTEPVLIKYPLARGTSDELVLQLLLEKIDAFEKVIGSTGDDMRKELDVAVKGEDALDALYERMILKMEDEKNDAKKQDGKKRRKFPAATRAR